MGYIITYEKYGIKTIVKMSNVRDCNTAIRMLRELGAVGHISKKRIGRSQFCYTKSRTKSRGFGIVQLNYWIDVKGHNEEWPMGWFYTARGRHAAIQLFEASGAAMSYQTKNCARSAHMYPPTRRRHGYNHEDYVSTAEGSKRYFFNKPKKEKKLTRPVISHRNFGDAMLALMEAADEQRKASLLEEGNEKNQEKCTCPICNKQFETRWDMIHHKQIARHHRIKPPKNIPCDLSSCQKKFRLVEAMHRHYQKAHMMVQLPNGIKRYKCRDCGNWGYIDGSGDFICPNHRK